MKKDYTKLFVGLIIVAIGTSLLFGQLGLESIFGFSLSHLLSILWPLIIVVLGFFIWVSSKNTAGLIIAIVGIFFLSNTVFDFNVWNLFWPLILIGLGFLILFKGSVKSTVDKSSGNFLSVNTIFSGSEKRVVSKDFEGGNIFVLFGGCEIDLREAKLNKDGANIDITAVFGGCEIFVPDNVYVISEGSALFGGWDNKAKSPAEKDVLELRITGTAVFGAVEVK